jgi:hypothetical protein
MFLLRCPHCNHWRCFQCADNSGLWLTCCKCGGKALAVQWYRGQAKGRPHDLEHSPRLGTGRPGDASKKIVEEAESFCLQYHIGIRALCRHLAISAWAFRQARAAVRPLPVMVERLLAKAIEDIKGGKVWLRRVTRQRRELEWVYPAYKASCPKGVLYCAGGLLPGSCPRRWKECAMSESNWDAAGKIHQTYANQKKILPGLEQTR